MITNSSIVLQKHYPDNGLTCWLAAENEQMKAGPSQMPCKAADASWSIFAIPNSTQLLLLLLYRKRLTWHLVLSELQGHVTMSKS